MERLLGSDFNEIGVQLIIGWLCVAGLKLGIKTASGSVQYVKNKNLIRTTVLDLNKAVNFRGKNGPIWHSDQLF